MRSLFRGASTGMTALLVLMLLLLVVLAALQYRWTGQLGIAEVDQMRANVESAVGRFAEDFDRELTRVLVYYLPERSYGDRYEEALLARYDYWSTNAPHPGLVDGVYLARIDGTQPQLKRLDPDTRQLATTDWSDAFQPIRRALSAPETGRRDRGRPWDVAPVFDEVPAIVVPLTSRPPLEMERGGPGSRERVPAPRAFAILSLDRDYIVGELLPELTQRYFGDGDYQIFVTRSDDKLDPPDSPSRATVVYRSDPETGTEDGDAQAPMFGLVSGRDFPPLLLEAGHPARGFDAGRRLRGRQERRPPGVPRAADKPWWLHAKHRRGSLEAAIAAVRFRNLSISFGILVLLAGSVTLILLSARRAQELARQKMEFVAGVSHELRTPLAVICSAGQNLADGVTGDPQRVRDYGKLIRDEGRRLSEMVSQVLEHAAVQSGRKSYGNARVRIPEVVEAALEDCKTLTEGFTIDKSYAEGLPDVEGDAGALRRAVQNLIVNAVKYTKDNSWIGIRVRKAGHDAPGGLSVTVEDRGRGIEPSERARIFEPFFRGAEAVADQIHGNGLGLSLVRQIAEAHGGRVSVVSSTEEAKHGSAFTLHLPAAPPAPASPESATANRRDDEVDGKVGHPVRG